MLLRLGLLRLPQLRPHRPLAAMTTLLAQSGAENQPTKIQRVAEVMEPLRVKKLSENATLPVRGSAGAAGYDLAR